jgi:hypothetical protein
MRKTAANDIGAAVDNFGLHLHRRVLDEESALHKRANGRQSGNFTFEKAETGSGNVSQSYLLGGFWAVEIQESVVQRHQSNPRRSCRLGGRLLAGTFFPGQKGEKAHVYSS